MKASGYGSRFGKFFCSPVLAVLSFSAAAGLLIACEKDEAPPPLPSTTPAPNPPQAKIDIAEEPPAEVQPDEPKQGGGKGSSARGLLVCCDALEQNAANAPQPNASYMQSAAGVCRSAAAAGQTQGAALAAIRAALQTAGMPSACQ